MKQPLSYQTLPCSCWYTSAVNALLVLMGDKNIIPGVALRLLNTVLTDEGVHNNGIKGNEDWLLVMKAIGIRCKLDINNYTKNDVDYITKMSFKNSVAICDIQGGRHSILITNRDNNFYYGFDPDWNQVKSNTISEAEVNHDYPNLFNFKATHEHFLSNKTSMSRPFAMGAISARNLTVITKVKSGDEGDHI